MGSKGWFWTSSSPGLVGLGITLGATGFVGFAGPVPSLPWLPKKKGSRNPGTLGLAVPSGQGSCQFPV